MTRSASRRCRSKFLLLALIGVTWWPAAASAQETQQRRETQEAQDQPGGARFDLRVEAKQLSLREIGRFVPAVERIGLPPGFRIDRLDVEGPLDRMRVAFAAGMDGSRMSGEVVLDLDGPVRAARGTSSLTQVDLANWLDMPTLPSQLTAEGRFDLAFERAGDRMQIRGTYVVTTPSLAVAGYRLGDVSASGRIDDRQVIVDARAIAYGAGVTAKGRVTLPRDGGAVRYALEGTARNLELRRLPEALPLPDIDSNLRFSYEVSGTGDDLRGRLVLSSSTIAGTSIPSATVDANRTRTGWSFAVDGSFAALDAARVTGRSGIDARMSGTMAVQGQVRTDVEAGPTTGVDLEDVTIGGTVTLNEAIVEGLRLDRGKFVGRLTNRAVHLEEARFAGPDLTVRLQGVFGLSPSIASNLSYYVETPPLASLPATLRFDLPLKGEMTLEGRIQGTSVLDITGTASGVNVGYGTTTALHARSTYHVALPRTDPAEANAVVRSEITRLHAAGRTFEALVARTVYRNRRLAFDAKLTEAKQRIETAGYVIWHPSHQEIHVDRFALAAAGTTWRLASQKGATIEYGGSAIAIENVRLVAPGNQTLSIEGTFGRGGAPLNVRASNLDVAAFDVWAGEYGFTGRLDVDARLAGVLTSPRIDAEFRVTDGSFRDFAYQSLSGRAKGGGQMPLTFEARLAHDPRAWIEASGRLPAYVFARLTAPPDAPVASGGELAVRVRSSAIPLGVVQGFTNAVTEVGGRLQVNATIDGTMAAPRVDGALTINDGAFIVPRLGARYTGLQTRIDFDARSLHVREFRMQDDDGRVLTVAGRLPLRAGGDESLDLELRADGFEIIDNPDADIELDGTLAIAGALTRPRVTGDIAISSGTIVLDRLLRLRDDTYALRAADQNAINGEVIRPEDEKGLLEEWPLALDLRLRIPALRFEGRDLQGPSNMPIGLGDVNVTAAGDLRLRKAPEDALRVTGEVRTTRGTYEFQGREFSLDRGGMIRFAGTEDINPLLDVTASRTVSAVEARVHIGGTLEEPTVSLSSSPPLEQADILSLIVFNRPVNELGAGEQVALTRRAAAMAAGIVASEITNALDDVLGVDLLDIEAATVNGVLAPAVTIGQQFGDLFIEVRQQFGPASPSQFVIEYRVTDWFRIESAIVDRESGSGPLLRRSEGTGIDAVFSFRR